MEELIKHTGLRVLMTTDTVGGVWSYSVELFKALQPFGVQFYLVTTGAPLQKAQKEEVSELQNVTIYETNFLLEWMENPWQSIDESGDWLLALEEKLQPHIIHLNGYAYGSLPWKAPVMAVAHSDVFSWWQAVKGEQPPAEWKEYYKRVRKSLNSADIIIAPSAVMLEYIKDIYEVQTPGKVIYNGRSQHNFYPAKKEPYIFSMGRIWDEAKNIKLLVEAAPHIHYPIKLAGDNSFSNNHCTTDGSNICYLGKLNTREVGVHLSAASVYVLPAKYEPFGLSVLEAALSGCALVLGNIGSLKEIWKDNAVYVDTDDSLALAETVNSLMENDALRNNYAQKTMKRAEQFSTEIMTEEYMKLYHQLVKHKKQILQQETV